MKNTLLLLVFIFAFFEVYAQIPGSYYNDATGKEGYELKTALYHIIKGHSVLDYGDLYAAYKTTDTKADNVVWDMYSDIPGGVPAYFYTHFNNNCGNYQSEGDCYNREHSFPQSWFNSLSPMKTDLFHVVPSDGKVNGMRSSYPYGEVASPTWTSTNGSKLGPSSFNGYTGTVFEPIDDYKGDFARSYFYMATRYENLIGTWQYNGSANEVLDGSSTRVFDDWCLNLFLKWHKNDPVSQKEIDRNNAIYTYQHNRNPYIDHPEYVQIIWEGAPADTVVPQDSSKTDNPAQFCTNFDNLPAASSSYSSRSWTDKNGTLWQASLARTDQEIDGKSICLKGNTAAFLSSSEIEGGLNMVTFTAQQKFSGSGGGLLLYVNDQFIERFDVSSQIKSFTSQQISVSRSFTIKLASSGETRIAIDDICMESGLTSQATGVNSKTYDLYPNPCKEQVIVQAFEPIKRIYLRDITGKLLKVESAVGMKKSINTTDLNSGLYFITVECHHGASQTKKIIKD